MPLSHRMQRHCVRLDVQKFRRLSRPAAPQLRPGAQLLRTWNGVTHRVDVVEDGYRYRGVVYRSLSAIAKRITGAHWSGPRFFGLVSRSKAA